MRAGGSVAGAYAVRRSTLCRITVTRELVFGGTQLRAKLRCDALGVVLYAA
jgi:hypothetical protein